METVEVETPDGVRLQTVRMVKPLAPVLMNVQESALEIGELALN